MKWTAPADDGGSPITAYRVVILKTDTEIENKNITDPDTTSLSVGGLDRGTDYSIKVYSRNAIFEGAAAQKTIRTKIEGNTSGSFHYSGTTLTKATSEPFLQIDQ